MGENFEAQYIVSGGWSVGEVVTVAPFIAFPHRGTDRYSFEP
jgi:hypothetical protein